MSTAMPDMITIYFTSCFTMLLAHLANPFRRNQLLAFPTTFVQNQLTELCQGFWLDMYSPTTGVYTFRTFFPCPFGYIHRREHTFLEIFCQFLASYFLNHCSQHIRHHRVIRILSTRCNYRLRQECTDPFLTTTTHVPVRFYTRCHGEQMTDGHIRQILRYTIRQQFREESSHTVIQSQTIVLDSQTYGNPYKCLRTRIHRMTVFRSIRLRIHFAYHLTMTHYHHRMHIGQRKRMKRIEQSDECFRRYPLFFRSRTRQFVGLCTDR